MDSVTGIVVNMLMHYVRHVMLIGLDVAGLLFGHYVWWFNCKWYCTLQCCNAISIPDLIAKLVLIRNKSALFIR